MYIFLTGLVNPLVNFFCAIGALVLFSDVLFSCSLKDPHGITRKARARLFNKFPPLATSNSKRSQIECLRTSWNQKNLQQLTMKTHPQARPAKRQHLEGPKPLKFTTLTHTPTFYFESPVPQKQSQHGRQNGASRHTAPTKLKKRKSDKNIKNQNLQ